MLLSHWHLPFIAQPMRFEGFQSFFYKCWLLIFVWYDSKYPTIAVFLHTKYCHDRCFYRYVFKHVTSEIFLPTTYSKIHLRFEFHIWHFRQKYNFDRWSKIYLEFTSYLLNNKKWMTSQQKLGTQWEKLKATSGLNYSNQYQY